MKFLISRSTDWFSEKRPIEEAYQDSYEGYDVRTLNSFEAYDRKFKDNFKDKGFDHCINDRGYIQRTFEVRGWFVDINSVEELVKLSEKVGQDLVVITNNNANYPEIEIYDGYRE